MTKAKSSITLRITAPDLDPDEITRLLECQPSEAFRKGEEQWVEGFDEPFEANQGLWNIQVVAGKNLDKSIRGLLAKMSSHLDHWKEIGKTCEVALLLFLVQRSPHEVYEISAKAFQELGDRQISLNMDVIYPG